MKTHEKILDAAFIMFAEYGYDGTSLNMISKKAGVSKGAIYHYYSSKEELYLKVIEHYFRNINSAIEKNFETIETIKQFGKELIEDYKTNNYINKFSLDIFFQSMKNENVKKTVLKMYKIGIELIKSSLYKLDNIDPENDLGLLAQKIWMLFDALCIYVSYGINVDFQKLWDEFMDDIFLKYLKKAPHTK
ncbi:TetR/AcrR family transcriptional regulator [Thermosipho ferrireducens]|uniref:TetR/AcrR family transcriptional regulator n=1 Tax=Thermosipho ferrireducens TaxID=2571116 RepID=A0ABX7S762_9BACT|nr:TetR/AcrR family transcriptional regulator [Thermosipho ferrireducens]QTA37686.1 TetR/AcrR family transcriptional regulator [Thermosipho ferrireducens]